MVMPSIINVGAHPLSNTHKLVETGAGYGQLPPDAVYQGVYLATIFVDLWELVQRDLVGLGAVLEAGRAPCIGDFRLAPLEVEGDVRLAAAQILYLPPRQHRHHRRLRG